MIPGSRPPVAECGCYSLNGMNLGFTSGILSAPVSAAAGLLLGTKCSACLRSVCAALTSPLLPAACVPQIQKISSVECLAEQCLNGSRVDTSTFCKVGLLYVWRLRLRRPF